MLAGAPVQSQSECPICHHPVDTYDNHFDIHGFDPNNPNYTCLGSGLPAEEFTPPTSNLNQDNCLSHIPTT